MSRSNRQAAGMGWVRTGLATLVFFGLGTIDRAAAQAPMTPLEPLPPTTESVGDEEVPPPAATQEMVETSGDDAPSTRRANPAEMAPTIRGETGLFRLITSDIGRQHSFRIALHTELFVGEGFLVQGDEHSRLVGTLAASYTPWRLLEIFASVRSRANSNDRGDMARLDEEVVFSLGDFSFGGKMKYPVTSFLDVGGHLAVEILNSVGGVGPDGSATGVIAGALLSAKLERFIKVPLGVHLNVGYHLDNSNDLQDLSNYGALCADAGIENRYPCAFSLHATKFAWGIEPSRVEVKVGADLPLRKWLGWGLTPMAELNFDVATGDADTDYADSPFLMPAGPIEPSEIDGRLTAWATVGAKASPVEGLILKLATDIGIAYPGFGYGPPVLPWNLIFGLGYAFEPTKKARTITKVHTVVRAPAQPETHKISGRVIDAATKDPIAGAVITFPGKDLTGLSTDPDGGFLTYPFPPGDLWVMVRHEEYKPRRLQTMISEGFAPKPLEIGLERAMPKTGRIEGHIRDLKGKPLKSAAISVSGDTSRTLPAAADGSFAADLPPGNYILRADAAGYLSKSQRVALTAGATATADFSLRPSSDKPLVRVSGDELLIRRAVHFELGTANLAPDAAQILDEVAHVILNHPGFRRIEIAGHTDSSGGEAFNQELSLKRAQAVRDFLIGDGVSPDRLIARGYGETRPKVPNITPRNRSLNRRVEFKIIARAQ